MKRGSEYDTGLDIEPYAWQLATLPAMQHPFKSCRVDTDATCVVRS